MSRLPTTLWIHYRLGRLLKRRRPDVFWSPNTLLPRDIQRFAPAVSTVHDLIHILVPKTLPLLMRFAYKRWFLSDVKKASRVVANSFGTARRLEEEVAVKAHGVARPAIPQMPSADSRIETKLRELGVRKPFFLTVGANGPRKNLPAVVKAIQILKSLGRFSDYQLVMCGVHQKQGRRLTRQIPESARWVNSIGYVDDALLAGLYRSAEAFLFPSLYEGYGMPVAEARSLGCRVVTTDIPELREAGGLESTYVDPSPEGIAAGIEEALSQPLAGPQKIGHDWTDAAIVMATMLTEAASGDRRQKDDLLRI